MPIVKRSNILPIGYDEKGDWQWAAPAPVASFLEAAQFPGQVYRGEKEVFDRSTGHVSDEALRASTEIGGGLMGAGQAIPKPAGSLGMFAGRNAKTADQIGLLSAAVGEHAGHNADNIYKNTGWYRGADKNWKYEIPDNEAQFMQNNVATVPVNGMSRVGDVLQHDKLFAAYPDLADIGVRNIADANGAYYGRTAGEQGKELIGLNLQNPGSENAKSMLLHELQHAIQKREGFARGANTQMDEIQKARPIMEMARALEEHQASGTMNTPDAQDTKRLLERMQWDAYARSAGEVEARAVQQRAYWTPERRMEQTPLAWESNAMDGMFHVPAEKQWVPGKERPFLDKYYGE